ncbi:hypothetical protein BS412_15660 [Cronobacter turicensis]|uniref:DUF551 domain-containing protein n=2 Tax=Cronobacter turicensis TaxID=413502 RepID=A0A2T7B4T0_9ENTR|nr:hypothetical protein [Cronobacter turicensis]PUX22027.1 hypothetical protein BS411_10885 [Cronobacter turicensis]PUX32351.1 hypothetical protein BS412_15660 [Cronobacter turicensis]
MSTISTEQAKDLRMAFAVWQQDYDPVEDKAQYEMFGLGIVAMDELLALRKERERAEPVYQFIYNNPYEEGYAEWLDCNKDYFNGVPEDCRRILYTAPPAPVVPGDWLPYDPQIAEYEQMMEAEQSQADTTSQQFESLAGKAVVPDGWKLVPIVLTKEMRGKIHPFAEATCLNCGRQVVADCEDNVTASWNDMLAVAPEPCK